MIMALPRKNSLRIHRCLCPVLLSGFIVATPLLRVRPSPRANPLSNLNYEAECNPNNFVFVTGLGWERQRKIVDQYALNDRRILPPSGIPFGGIQGVRRYSLS